jgi:aryl-alcohol dehydrogenase-like predicted oxidoreductase
VIRSINLGPRGLKIGAQGLGCLSLTGFYGHSFDEGTAIATISRALDLGVTLLDTADSYAGDSGRMFGANEEFVGKAIRGRRLEAILATKFGFVDPSLPGDGRRAIRGDPNYVRSACHASLRRLGADHLDLYFCHRVDGMVPIEETVGAMADLVAEGKVRYIGLSAVSADTLSRAVAIHPITALESEWSLWTRDIEKDILPRARTLGVGIVPYAPLGRGFLTGHLRSPDDLAPDDYRRTSPRFQGDNFARNLELVDNVRTLAREKNCTTTQVALAWLHAQGDDVAPIPGANRPAHVSENVIGLNIELSADDLATIDSIFPTGAAAGAPYADMSGVIDPVQPDDARRAEL